MGAVLALADDAGLRVLEFDGGRADAQIARAGARAGREIAPGDHPTLAALGRELERYFAGEGRLGWEEPLPFAVEPLGATPFQRLAWEALRAIPLGATRSYAQQAAAIGRPTAVRAVARANGDNPLAIVVPCHRVIGAGGSLTGYGGGLDRKRWLLDHEARMTGSLLASAGVGHG